MSREAENPTSEKIKKRRDRDRKRSIFFKVGFSIYWRKPIHIILKNIRNKFPTLAWLRVSMSYHRFANLRETFQGDLTAKLIHNIGSLDFADLPCNCRNKAACQYGGKCRSSIVVYQATCLATGKRYIGNTQQHVKKRIQQHVQDAKKLAIMGKKSDSFADHFAQLLPPTMDRKEMTKHVKVKVELLWKGNPLSCVKTFGTKGCKLCAHERLEILKLVRFEPEKAINKNNEVYGACRHKPRFHKFCRLTRSDKNASTDESTIDERVLPLDSTSSSSTTSSIFSFESTDSSDQRERNLIGFTPKLAHSRISIIGNEDLALVGKIMKK